MVLIFIELLSYLQNLTSEFTLAAGVLDPEFSGVKPWLWPGAIEALTTQFRKRYNGTQLDEDTHQMLSEFDLYKDKREKFSPSQQ